MFDKSLIEFFAFTFGMLCMWFLFNLFRGILASIEGDDGDFETWTRLNVGFLAARVADLEKEVAKLKIHAKGWHESLYVQEEVRNGNP